MTQYVQRDERHMSLTGASFRRGVIISVPDWAGSENTLYAVVVRRSAYCTVHLKSHSRDTLFVNTRVPETDKDAINIGTC